jgi:hypothetical protein
MFYSNLSEAQIIAILNDPRITLVLSILAIWELAWKGIALWKAAGNGSKPWFIALLIINTVGILPIIYVFFFSKKKK